MINSMISGKVFETITKMIELEGMLIYKYVVFSYLLFSQENTL